MKAVEVLNKALKELELPVARIFYKEQAGKPKPDVYLTYQLILGAGELYADDDNEATESTWRVDLYSRGNYEAKIREVTRVLKESDFYAVTLEAEQFEQDTGYYHISFNAKYLEFSELEE
jgi:hypothetical protein